MHTAAVILAHQGNWDEMLMVAVPIALFALILHRANKKADRIQAGARPEATNAPDPGDAPDATGE